MCVRNGEWGGKSRTKERAKEIMKVKEEANRGK